MANVMYYIKVDIHEVKDVLYKEESTERETIPNVFVEASFKDYSNYTQTKEHSSNAFFNASFNFTPKLSPSEFERGRIIVALYHKEGIASYKKLIGHHAFSLPLIYSKQQHCIHRSWVKVFNPNFPTHNAGSMLVSISVSAPGDKPAVFKDDDLSGQGLGTDIAQTGIRFNKVPEMNLKNYMLYLNVVCGRDFMLKNLSYSEIKPSVRLSHFGIFEETPPMNDNTNPEWQTTLYIPCLTPSFDETVTVEFYNGTELLQFESIDLVHLINNGFPPKWINIYSKGVGNQNSNLLGGILKFFSDSTSSLTDYFGRILISASAEQVQTLYVKGIKPCRSISLPPIQERKIAVDIYEIVSLDHKYRFIEVIISQGIFSTKSRVFQLKNNGSYEINDITGRLQVFEPSFSSNDDGDLCDFFIYVNSLSDGTCERVSWARVPYEKVKNSETKPMWILLSSFANEPIDLFNILLSFEVSSNIAGFERKERIKYNLARYNFRCMIYEAFQLPCLETNCYPSSYIEVELSGVNIKTGLARDSTNPYYFCSREEEVYLPTNLLLAPNINISVFYEQNSVFSRPRLVCTGQYSLTNVPREWTWAPQWLKLRSLLNPMHKPRVLVAFELIPSAELTRSPESFPFFEDIVPSTRSCILTLVLLGIRTFSLLENPRVQIRFKGYDTFIDPECHSHKTANGHSSHNSGNLGEGFDILNVTGKATSGSYGNWNFLTTHVINLELPKRMHHHSCLDLQVICDNSAGPLGSTVLTLNQYFPWLTPTERKLSNEMFRMELIDCFNSSAPSNTVNINKTLEDVNNINVEFVDEIDAVSKHKSRFHAIDSNTNINATVNSVENNSVGNDVTGKSKIATEGNDNIDNITSETTSASDARDSVIRIDEGDEDDKLIDEDELDFEILIDDSMNSLMREEISYELEAEMTEEAFQYKKAPILRFNENGIPEVIGILKFIIQIQESSNNRQQQLKQIEIMQREADEKIRRFRSMWDDAKDLVVRAYILEAKGLYTSGLINDSISIKNITGEDLTYIWIRNIDDQHTNTGNTINNTNTRNSVNRSMLYPYSIKDLNNGKKGLKPIFNQCYNLSCSLPENSILRVSVMSKSALSETIIGTTYIDCEDRFFNARLRELMLGELAPVESRVLRGEEQQMGETISRGVLRMWLEVLRAEDARAKPIQNLGSLDPANYELRVVIWRARCFSDETSEISLYVCGFYQNELGEFVQKTDTHYHSKDKIGIFNWRFKYLVTIPTEYTNLKLQLYSYTLLKDEVIGEANIDLGYEFHRVWKKNRLHSIPKFTANLYSLADSSKIVGSVDVEISLLNESDSKRYPVGAGREEPNRDPYLPKVNQNRNFVDFAGFGDTFVNFGNKIISGIKTTGAIIVVLSIFALAIVILIIIK
uniref:C2 domain containing protein, putative n=1 Tax=Theileria annulata TaxID=5874 RepID=A0A3B0NB21_THEAN